MTADHEPKRPAGAANSNLNSDAVSAVGQMDPGTPRDRVPTMAELPETWLRFRTASGAELSLANAVAMMIAMGGLRVEEILRLTAAQHITVDGVECFTWTNTKSYKPATVPLTEAAKDILQRAIDVRAGDPSTPLFPNRKGELVTSTALSLAFRC